MFFTIVFKLAVENNQRKYNPPYYSYFTIILIVVENKLKAIMETNKIFNCSFLFLVV